MAVRESPEVAAVVRRLGQAWGSRDFETYSNLISTGPHFRGIGTDADEFWDSSEQFLQVRRLQLGELDGQGWSEAQAVVERVEAFEDGSVGWALVLFRLQTPVGDLHLRTTAVLSLEKGAWKLVQWHSSVPSPNVQNFGVELTTTLDELLTSVAEDDDALESLGGGEGTLTLVFTDIVDSTTLTEQMGDERWVTLMKSHEADIRHATAAHGGTLVKMTGDGSLLSFTSSRAAVRAALEIQDKATDAGYLVRIGAHAGEVITTEGDVLGTTVNKAARVASVAAGGQVLVSDLVAELVGAVDGIGFGQPEAVTLKGLSGTHTLVPIESGQTR